MSRKASDNSPRFDRGKSYAIGVLQSNALASDVPSRFSNTPIKPLYLTGTDLVGAGMKSCRDFLISKNCHFRVGSAVHFYEVEYGNNNEAPLYKNIFIGSPLPQTAIVEQSLGDKVESGVHTINNIIPSYNATEYEKMFFKSQSDAIAYYQKCLADERKQFADERSIYTIKQQEQNDKILELNLQINRLKSENVGLQIKYEEVNKYADRMSQMVKEIGEQPKQESPPEGLADKGIAMIDGMLGDGASQQLVMGLASGLGSGIGKLIDFGVDYIKENRRTKVQSEPARQNIEAPVSALNMSASQVQLEQQKIVSNTEKYNQELGWSE